jgi:cysteinyl-tRNA synthetase
MIKLYNTLKRKKEIFKPLKEKIVGLYTCGPTVYWFAHIGNLRTYIFEDLLKRVLEYNDYKVKHVMNITDVGHLTSDADTGEDKMEKGAKREGKTAWEIAKFYTEIFQSDLKKLNIKPPDIWIKATDTIQEQIELIKILEKKGFTYKIADGIYFDTSKLKTYGRLWPKKIKIKSGARIEMVPGKKNPTDFALWKFSPMGVKRQMEWESPWGVGFPGWHTECVVMSSKYLGIPFDIHCGGIDHILIHHTNEIAQAEAAFGKNLANYWMHGEFLTLEGGKMAKSDGNILTAQTLIDKGFNPLAYRYLCLTAHYRSKLSFSWKAMEGSQNSLNNLYEIILNLKQKNSKEKLDIRILKESQNKFLQFINNDLDIPKALALLWKKIKDKKINNKTKLEIAFDFDKVFGLNLDKVKVEKIPTEIKEMAEEREKHRKLKEWQKADEIRQKIESLGYQIKDTKKGPKIKKI